MTSRNVLFISGSIGLGHVTRDLAIAAELRRQRPELRLVWLAGEPAQQALRAAGEEMVSESERWADETIHVETMAQGFRLNLSNPASLLGSVRALQALRRLAKGLRQNLCLFKELIRRETFDLIIATRLTNHAGIRSPPKHRPSPAAFIVDFVGSMPPRGIPGSGFRSRS